MCFCFLGVRLRSAAERLPDGGGPAAPAGETPGGAERQRPRAPTEAPRCRRVSLCRRSGASQNQLVFNISRK